MAVSRKITKKLQICSMMCVAVKTCGYISYIVLPFYGIFTYLRIRAHMHGKVAVGNDRGQFRIEASHRSDLGVRVMGN
jgi:hypothetical protein